MGKLAQRMRRRMIGSLAAVLLVALTTAVVPDPAIAAAPSQPRSNYPPCSTITWAYDASDQPDSGASMPVDIRAALTLLRDRTGIVFREVPIDAEHDLGFNWSPLDEYEAGTQAAGWRSQVTFATGGELVLDQWTGFGRKAVSKVDGSFDVGIGRGWLVVHEVLHSLGLPHSDEAGSVMSPIVRMTNVLGLAPARRQQRALPRPGFSPGDLATLETMYPRDGCPVSRS